jgi:hypothetical protein
MGDFSAEGPVVHEEDLQVFIIPHEELLESVRQVESGLAVAAVAAFRHGLVAAEASHSVVYSVVKYLWGVASCRSSGLGSSPIQTERIWRCVFLIIFLARRGVVFTISDI